MAIPPTPTSTSDDGFGSASALRAPVELSALVAEVMHKALDAVDDNWHLSCMDPDGDGSCSKGHRARQMLAEDVAPKVLDALDEAGLLLTDRRRRELLGDPAALAGWTREQSAANERFNASLRFEDGEVI